MICPQCKAEYRDGFTQCADCEVDLVHSVQEIPRDRSDVSVVHESDATGTRPENDPFCQFWKGEDPRAFAELCAILTEAEIPYQKVEWEDRLFNSVKFPEFRLAVPFSMFEKAEQALVEA